MKKLAYLLIVVLGFYGCAWLKSPYIPLKIKDPVVVIIQEQAPVPAPVVAPEPKEEKG